LNYYKYNVIKIKSNKALDLLLGIIGEKFQ